MSVIKITKLQENSLNNILYHKQIEGLKRFSCVEKFPCHIAIHDINLYTINSNEYVKPHKHPNPELNIVWGNEDFKLQIKIEGQDYILKRQEVIWIPENTMHSVKAIEGKGLYICLVLSENYIAKD